MKQHISIEQLNELSDKGKERLREWWEPLAWHVIYAPDLYDGVLSSVADIPYGTLKDYYPLLSIGQMIELLDGKFINFWRGLRKNWLIVIDDEEHIVKDELCDALWEAVKEVLERE